VCGCKKARNGKQGNCVIYYTVYASGSPSPTTFVGNGSQVLGKKKGGRASAPDWRDAPDPIVSFISTGSTWPRVRLIRLLIS
jgi:hypothetical protein